MARADELLLHIGQAKTGTTTLQHTLLGAQAALRQQGVHYPRFDPGHANAVILAYHLFGHTEDNAERQRWLGIDPAQLGAVSARAWRGIEDAVTHHRPRTLVLSSEIFFRPMNRATITSANRQIDQVARTSRIVAYLRAPDAHFLSFLQQILRQLGLNHRLSRTHVKDTIAPLITGWRGPVSLNVFDRAVMTDGDIVTDFLSKHLPDVAPSSVARLQTARNTSLSAEAMALLHDIATDRTVWRGGRNALAVEIVKADRRLDHPTTPQLNAGMAQALINWRAPDLFWLRDDQGIIFPGIDYGAIDENDVDDAVLRVNRIEDICTLNPDRKAALLHRAKARARLPRPLRRLLYRYHGDQI